MKEKEGRLYFDLDHVHTLEYKHLGEDIGAREAIRATAELSNLIGESLDAQSPDSPVYTFLPKLQQPRLSDDELAELMDDKEAEQELLSKHMRDGEIAGEESRHNDAACAYKAANEMKPKDPFIIQQLALHTYKSKKPSVVEALKNGIKIISDLKPGSSNDPETLGITGAIYKQLWLENKDTTELDAAIFHYKRGFELRRDYYNGENLATCYEFRSSLQTDMDEALYDRMSARKVREAIIEELTAALKEPSFEDRTDQRWVFATLSNCYYATGKKDKGEHYEELFKREDPAEWELDSFEKGKRNVLSRA